MTARANELAWADRLEALGLAVRDRLIAARDAGDDLATAVAQEGGDTIFAIDRHVEPVIEAAIHAWPDACKPLLLVAEGMGQDGRRLFLKPTPSRRGQGEGANVPMPSKTPSPQPTPEGRGGKRPPIQKDSPPAFRLIIDPIDGTRNIMYDKRSAWFLAAVAPERGDATRLSDAFASVMIELPTSKQGYADSFTAVRGGKTIAKRRALSSLPNAQHGCRSIPVQPSRATTLKHGFAQVANFFPGTKVLASELMERIAAATLGAAVEPGAATIFDDQYMTTGGQMVELMLGHDRFCGDLRPLFYRILEQHIGSTVRGLECHPYDAAGMLVAQQAGVILTDGLGRPLDAPMDVHSGVHWCGYANEALRRQIEPVIVAWFADKGVRGGI